MGWHKQKDTKMVITRTPHPMQAKSIQTSTGNDTPSVLKALVSPQPITPFISSNDDNETNVIMDITPRDDKSEINDDDENILKYIDKNGQDKEFRTKVIMAPFKRSASDGIAVSGHSKSKSLGSKKSVMDKLEIDTKIPMSS